jgi:hypothetical protein
MNLTLTHQEINHIVEALLFSSSVSVGADWHKEDCESMLQIALYLKEVTEDNLKLENINFLKEEDYEDTCSEKILEEFGSKLEVYSLDNI